MGTNKGIYKNKIGALISYISMIISIVIGMVITPIMLKKLGDSEYGIYILIASLISYLNVIQNGFSDTIMRYAARFRAKDDKDMAARFNGLSLCINLIASVIVGALGVLLIIQFPTIYANSLTETEIALALRLLYLMVFNVIITFISNGFFGYLAAYEEFIVLRGTELANQVISNLMIVAILFLGRKSFEIVIITTVCNLISRLFEAIYCWKKLHIRFDFSLRKLEPKFLREVGFYFLTVFIVVIVEQIYWKLDNILIAGVVSASAVAVYSLGMSFHKYFMKFSTTISKVMAPRFFVKIDSGADKYKVTQMLIRISRIQAIPILLALSGLIVYGKDFISLWVGDSYSIAYYIALVTLIPYSLELVGNLRNVILQARGLYMKKSLLLLIVSIMNIVLTLWWIRLYGIIGAAVATGLGIIVGYVGVTIILKKNDIVDNKRYLKETYLHYLIPVALSMICGFFLKLLLSCNSWMMFFIHVALYTLIYIILIILIGLNLEEKQYVKNMFMRN